MKPAGKRISMDYKDFVGEHKRLINTLSPVVKELGKQKRELKKRIKRGGASFPGVPEKNLVDMCIATYDIVKNQKPAGTIGDFMLVEKSPTVLMYKKKDDSCLVIAVRGTASMADWSTNTSLIVNGLSGTTRYKEAANFIRDNLDDYSVDHVYLTGHSLGGAICDDLLNDGYGEKAITFNPATQPKYLRNSGNTRVYNANEALYNMFGWMASNKEIRKPPLTVFRAIEDFFLNATSAGQLYKAWKMIPEHSLENLAPDPNAGGKRKRRRRGGNVDEVRAALKAKVREAGGFSQFRERVAANDNEIVGLLKKYTLLTGEDFMAQIPVAPVAPAVAAPVAPVAPPQPVAPDSGPGGAQASVSGRMMGPSEFTTETEAAYKYSNNDPDEDGNANGYAGGLKPNPNYYKSLQSSDTKRIQQENWDWAWSLVGLGDPLNNVPARDQVLPQPISGPLSFIGPSVRNKSDYGPAALLVTQLSSHLRVLDSERGLRPIRGGGPEPTTPKYDAPTRKLMKKTVTKLNEHNRPSDELKDLMNKFVRDFEEYVTEEQVDEFNFIVQGASTDDEALMAGRDFYLNLLIEWLTPEVTDMEGSGFLPKLPAGITPFELATVGMNPTPVIKKAVKEVLPGGITMMDRIVPGALAYKVGKTAYDYGKAAVGSGSPSASDVKFIKKYLKTHEGVKSVSKKMVADAYTKMKDYLP
jgi:hypothetical protein